MKTSPELLEAAERYKKYIWLYFFDRKRKASKYLAGYAKHELNALMLLSISKPTELSVFLKWKFHYLESLINNPVYTYYQIKKKRGGLRDIYAPGKDLKKIQKHLNYFLQAYYLCLKPDGVYGFVINPGYMGKCCNIVANAQMHTGKKYVLNIDLKDFFSNISAGQVWHLFSSELFSYDDQIATALTLLTTYESRLPTGSPTSPVISNFICIKLDNDLGGLAKANAFSYSRYADDLTFSSNDPISNEKIIEIQRLITCNGFMVNEEKLRLISSTRKQTVTGITVNEKVNANRKLLKKIRAMVHDMQTNGIHNATQKHFNLQGSVDKRYITRFISRLEGYINFVGQVKGQNDTAYLKLKSTFDGNFYKPYSKII